MHKMIFTCVTFMKFHHVASHANSRRFIQYFVLFLLSRANYPAHPKRTSSQLVYNNMLSNREQEANNAPPRDADLFPEEDDSAIHLVCQSGGFSTSWPTPHAVLATPELRDCVKGKGDAFPSNAQSLTNAKHFWPSSHSSDDLLSHGLSQDAVS